MSYCLLLCTVLIRSWPYFYFCSLICNRSFLWLLYYFIFLFCFQQFNSGGPRCDFLQVNSAWGSLKFGNLQIEILFLSNLREFPQIFLCPNLSSYRIPTILDYLILSLPCHRGSVHFMFLFFTPCFSLNCLYWSVFKFMGIFFYSAQTAVRSIQSNFSFHTTHFSVLGFLFGCFLNFHFSTKIPICSLCLDGFLIYSSFPLCYHSYYPACLVFFF